MGFLVAEITKAKIKKNLFYKLNINLNTTLLEELEWWCNNLILNKGIPIKIQNTEIIIQSDVVKSRDWVKHPWETALTHLVKIEGTKIEKISKI